MGTQELNPTIIPPDVLKTILHNIENDIKSNARLKLCEDPNTNIWSYYGTIKLTPIVFTGLFDVNSNCTFSRPNPVYGPV